MKNECSKFQVGVGDGPSLFVYETRLAMMSASQGWRHTKSFP